MEREVRRAAKMLGPRPVSITCDQLSIRELLARARKLRVVRSSLYHLVGGQRAQRTKCNESLRPRPPAFAACVPPAFECITHARKRGYALKTLDVWILRTLLYLYIHKDMQACTFASRIHTPIHRRQSERGVPWHPEIPP